MKNIFKNYDEDDILSKLLLLYFAFQHGAVGLVFIFQSSYIVKMEAFRGMSKLLPMDAWGIILVISAVCFVLSIIQEHFVKYYFMIIAGSTGMVAFSLLSMANLELAVNQTNSLNYIIIASIDVLIAILGGVAIWLRKVS